MSSQRSRFLKYINSVIILEYPDVVVKMSLIGADVDVGFKTMYANDPSNKRAVAVEIGIINDQSEVKANTIISGDSAYYSSSTSQAVKAIPDVFGPMINELMNK